VIRMVRVNAGRIRAPASTGSYREGMRTVGVDLAAEPARTAVAWIDWSTSNARVSEIELRADDDSILDAIASADKAGIDCPLGWPDRFVEFITAHRAGNVDVPVGLTGRAWRRDLTLRITDQVVYDLTGLTPLSVSADRIAHTAMRCAGLLAELARRGTPVDRSGDGIVVEVYPAASLRRWQLPHRSYKRARNLSELNRLIDELHAAAPWLDLGAYEQICRTSDDAVDAVVAALTARASSQGMATVPPHKHADIARTEGWIVLPTTSLAQLRP
jgi:predicted nuclease with RNAse H fold